MPKYLIEMHDGRKFQVEADSPPSEAEVLAHLGETPAPQDKSAVQNELLALHGIRPDVGEEPDLKTRLGDALEPLAHPKSLGDVAALLIPSGGGALVAKGVGAAADTVKKYGGAVADLAGTAVEMLAPRSARAAKAGWEVVKGLSPTEWKSPLTVAGRDARAHAAVADQVDRYLPNRGGLPTAETPMPSAGRVPYAVPAVIKGKGLQSIREVLAKKALSDLEFATQEYEAGRLSEDLYKKIVQQAETAAQRLPAGTKLSPQTSPQAPSTAAEVPAVAPAEPVIRMGPDGKLVGRPGGNPDLPDQRALNEAALAQRRAQQPAAAVDTPTPTAPKLTLTADEARIGMQLLKAGKTADEALAHILALRDAKAGAFGSLPNDAEMKAQLTVRKLTGKWAGDSAPKGWTVALPEKP